MSFELAAEPAGATPAADAAPDLIGQRIRRLRRAQQLTLAALAGMTGISIGHLSEVERGIAIASVKLVKDIAQAMGVQIGWFFHAEPADHAAGRRIVQRRGQRKTVSYGALGVRDHLLSPHLHGALELLLCEIEPNGGSGAEPYTHEGEEAGLVLAGALELWVGDDHFLIEAGDSFAFPSSAPHRYRNPGPTVAQVVWAITPPSF